MPHREPRVRRATTFEVGQSYADSDQPQGPDRVVTQEAGLDYVAMSLIVC